MRIPKHIAIIPDGNRRWAQGHGMEKKDGYTYGLKPGLEVLQQAKKYGVEEVTYYGFTVDNCKRPAAQVEAFQNACVEAVRLLCREGADLLVVGNADSKCFPKELTAYTTRTKINGGGIRVNFLVNYGWEWDLSHMELDGTPYSKDVGRIELVIRWGGMRRLSGLLPIQSVYADFYVADSLWPDYEKSDFEAALQWYTKQDITLGG